jgi:hypothetical protein
VIRALGPSFTISIIALAAALAGGGAFALGDVGASTAALAPVLLGLAAGEPCAAGSASGLSGGSFSAGCSYLGLTSPRARCSRVPSPGGGNHGLAQGLAEIGDHRPAPAAASFVAKQRDCATG